MESLFTHRAFSYKLEQKRIDFIHDGYNGNVVSRYGAPVQCTAGDVCMTLGWFQGNLGSACKDDNTGSWTRGDDQRAMTVKGADRKSVGAGGHECSSVP